MPNLVKYRSNIAQVICLHFFGLEQENMTQNYWVFRLFPSSHILKTRKHKFRKLDLVPKRRVFYFLKYRTMDKVRKSSNSERYTPWSESFRVEKSMSLHILIFYRHRISFFSKYNVPTAYCEIVV
jgi:hypothetical protein